MYPAIGVYGTRYEIHSVGGSPAYPDPMPAA